MFSISITGSVQDRLVTAAKHGEKAPGLLVPLHTGGSPPTAALLDARQVAELPEVVFARGAVAKHVWSHGELQLDFNEMFCDGICSESDVQPDGRDNLDSQLLRRGQQDAYLFQLAMTFHGMPHIFHNLSRKFCENLELWKWFQPLFSAACRFFNTDSWRQRFVYKCVRPSVHAARE